MNEWIWVSPSEKDDMSDEQRAVGMTSIRADVTFMFTIYVNTERLLIYTINWAHPDRGKMFAYVHSSLLVKQRPMAVGS